MTEGTEDFYAFRAVPRTGVIYVTAEAARLGYVAGDPEWCNLGQGMPEIGQLPLAPARINHIDIASLDHEYAPVAGLWELRESIASLYNQLFRRGMPSKYSAENVAVSGGGRMALTRVAAAIGAVNLGHFLPDYTAYEELLDVFRSFCPIPIVLDAEQNYTFSIDELRREITNRGLAALLLSNPCNPTGKLVAGEELGDWVRTARDLQCTLLLDEFYSHYVWRDDVETSDGIVSAARYVEDVNQDPVVILDGLTKNWRYPGWRVTWTVAPKSIIERVVSSGSFLDGGACRPLQRAAMSLLNVDDVRAETKAIRTAFLRKRAIMIKGLTEIGFELGSSADGTFYVWASAKNLPEPLRDGMGFFRAALAERVITVPGAFFDVDPGQRRASRPSRFRHHLRFSFGPELTTIETALARLATMIRAS